MAEMTVNADPIYCPSCGFDLRATQSTRCGECGLEFDRAMINVSAIPWAHRQHIGRITAYLKTAWQFSADRQTIRHETVRPQNLKDARSFARITAEILAIALLLAYGATMILMRSMAFLAVGSLSFGRQAMAWADFQVPWSAGIMILPLPPICLILLAFWLTGAQRFVFRTNSTPEARLRAFCISHYLTAPLLLVLPAVLLFASAIGNELTSVSSQPGPAYIMPMKIAGAVLLLIGLLTTFGRIVQWLIRTRPCGWVKANLLAVEWVGLLLLGAAVILGLIPWCAGFIRIVIDTLR